MGFPRGSVGKESACNVGDQGLIPGSARSAGEGNGSLLQYSCLENSMGRGTLQATVCKEANMTERLITTRNNKLIYMVERAREGSPFVASIF